MYTELDLTSMNF